MWLDPSIVLICLYLVWKLESGIILLRVFTQYWSYWGCSHSIGPTEGVHTVLILLRVFTQYWSYWGCSHSIDPIEGVHTVFVLLRVFTQYWSYWGCSHSIGPTEGVYTVLVLLRVFTQYWLVFKNVYVFKWSVFLITLTGKVIQTWLRTYEF